MKNIFSAVLMICMAVVAAAQPMIPPSNVSPITGPAVVGRGAGNGRATTITLGPNLTITNNVIDSIGGGGGSGNVTAAGTLTANNIVIGQGSKATATSSTFSISGSNATVTGNLAVSGNQTVGNNLTTVNLTISGAIIGVVPMPNGGTGFSTTTAGNIIIGNNTTTFGQLAVGSNGTVLTANTSAPLKVSWETPGAGTGNVTGGSLTDNHIVLGNGTNSIGVIAGLGSTGQPLVSAGASAPPAFAVLGVVGGGTGLATITANSIMIGNGTNTPILLAAGTSGNVVTSNGTGWVSSPAAGGGGANLTMTATLGSDDTYTGATLAGLNAGATIAQWEAVYVGGSSTYLLANATATAHPAFGLAVAAYSSSDPAVILREGPVRNDAWNWTIGGRIFLSTAAGALTQTAPSASTNIVQQVGVALTADIAYFYFASGEYVTVP